MSTSRKLLVGCAPDERTPIKKGDFLVPIESASSVVLMGTKSRRQFRLGALVYVGVDVDEAALLERAVPSGLVEPSVASTEQFADYLRALQNFKIGDVLRLDQTTPGRMLLVKEHLSLPPSHKPRIP